VYTDCKVLWRKRVRSGDQSTTMTWLPWNPSCIMSTTLVVMCTATRHHEGGKYARTILYSSVGDLSSVSAARGILFSFQLSVKVSGNWPPGVYTMFSTALDPVGCSITIATPPMACTDYSTCPPFLRFYPDATTIAASNIQTPHSKVHSAASPNLVRMLSSKKIPADNRNTTFHLWIPTIHFFTCCITLPYSTSVQYTSSPPVVPSLQSNTYKQG
jgi:hypothetical protein